MAITDNLYAVSILIGLFIVHFGIPTLLIWVLKVLVCWGLRDTEKV